MKVKYSPEAGKIYTGNVLSNGRFGSHYGEVTEQCIRATFEYLVNMKMNSDSAQTLEFVDPVLKHGKKFKVSITIEPDAL